MHRAIIVILYFWLFCGLTLLGGVLGGLYLPVLFAFGSGMGAALVTGVLVPWLTGDRARALAANILITLASVAVGAWLHGQAHGPLQFVFPSPLVTVGYAALVICGLCTLRMSACCARLS